MKFMDDPISHFLLYLPGINDHYWWLPRYSSFQSLFLYYLASYWHLTWVHMVSAPPPKVMGGPENFDPYYLGGRIPTLPDIGGTLSNGGSDWYGGGSFNIQGCKNICVYYTSAQS